MKILRRSFSSIHQSAFKLGPRCYIPTGIGVEKFFETLNASAVDYSVLRWFENLPDVMDGEDIDILVADAHLPRIFSLASRAKIGGVPLDVYGVSGNEFTTFNGVPYFPAALADYILLNSFANARGIRVPTVDAHLAGLAFHAVFHKDNPAFNRDLGNAEETSRTRSKRLRREIEHLHEKSNWQIPEISLAGLDSFLTRSGFGPTPELREFFARRNAYARENLSSLIAEKYRSKNLVSAFFIREAGVEFIESIRDILREAGFTILKDQGLTHEQTVSVTTLTRGGNWSAGDAPRPGGLPVHILLVLDEFPLPPPRGQKHGDQYLFVQNLRIHSAKKKIREAWTSRVGLINESNIVHSTDNGYTTEFAAKLVFPENEVDTIIGQKVQGREVSEALERAGFDRVPRHENASVLFSVDKSAEAEQLTMVKVFRSQSREELAVEELARTMGADCDIASSSRSTGSNWLEFPATRNLKALKTMSPQQILQFRRFYSSCASEGINLLNYAPGGLYETAAGKLEFVDFNTADAAKNCDSMISRTPRFSIPRGLSVAGNQALGKTSPRQSRRRWASSGWARATGLPFWIFNGNFGVKSLATVQKVYFFYLSMLDFFLAVVARVGWVKNLPIRGLRVVGVITKRLQTRSRYTNSLRFSFPKPLRVSVQSGS